MQKLIAFVGAIFALEQISGITTNLTWISTKNEGITEHLTQLNKIYQMIRRHCKHRGIEIVPFQNTLHYMDVDYVSLCDYFEFPSSILCGSSAPSTIIDKRICTMHPCLPSQWFCHPEEFGLTGSNNGLKNNMAQLLAGNRFYMKDFVLFRKPNYCNDSCSLLKFNLPDDHGLFFNIKFSSRFQVLFSTMKRRLLSFLDSKVYSSSDRNIRDSGVQYAVVHWRRGDQMTERCGRLSPSSLVTKSYHCANASTLIRKIKSSTPSNEFVYVATNERDASTLAELHHAGLYTWTSLFNASVWHVNLSSIEVFVLELMLMNDSSSFFYGEQSTVGTFANTLRLQNNRTEGVKLT